MAQENLKEVDNQTKQPGLIKRSLPQLIIGMVFGFIGGILIFGYMERRFGDDIKLLFVNLLGILALFIAFTMVHVIVHEAGHLLFGLLTGYGFVSFRLGSFTLVREQGRLKLKRYSMPGTLGQCLMAPPEITKGELPFQLYNYGGVILNIGTSLIIGSILFVVSDLPILLELMIGCYSIGGLLLGILNGFPIKSSGVANDGYNVKYIKQDPIARNSFYMQLYINEKQSLGQRLKDMPMDWFLMPGESDLTNALNAYMKLLEYYRFLDLLNLEAARNSLEDLKPNLGKLPLGFQNLYQLELFFLTLVTGGSKIEAEGSLTKEAKLLLKLAKNDISIKRIAYTYQLLYLNDQKEAQKCYEAALKLAKVYPVIGEAEGQMMLIEFVKGYS